MILVLLTSGGGGGSGRQFFYSLFFFLEPLHAQSKQLHSLQAPGCKFDIHQQVSCNGSI